MRETETERKRHWLNTFNSAATADQVTVWVKVVAAAEVASDGRALEDGCQPEGPGRRVPLPAAAGTRHQRGRLGRRLPAPRQHLHR